MTERFRTLGLIPAIATRIFATGSYRGSFRGELAVFVSIAEREARSRCRIDPDGPSLVPTGI